LGSIDSAVAFAGIRLRRLRSGDKRVSIDRNHVQPASDRGGMEGV